MAEQLPAFDVENAPLEQFIEPQSPMESIIRQMQAAQQRSIPRQTPQDLIAQLLQERMSQTNDR